MIPAAIRTHVLNAKIQFHADLPVFSEMKIAIKSVPPLELPAKRHRLIATELIMPPKTAHRSMSSVSCISGTKSVSRPDAKIITME